MQASAMRAYLNRFAVSLGKTVAVFTSTDDGWQTAMDLARTGTAVAAVIDPRPYVNPRLAAAVEAAGGRVINGLQMLLHQAFAQVEQFTGLPAPVDAMKAALAGQ